MKTSTTTEVETVNNPVIAYYVQLEGEASPFSIASKITRRPVFAKPMEVRELRYFDILQYLLLEDLPDENTVEMDFESYAQFAALFKKNTTTAGLVLKILSVSEETVTIALRTEE